MNLSTSVHPCIDSDRMVGTNVYNSSGDKLGSADSLMIDKQSDQVRFAAMEFGGFLGMGSDRYPVPWSMFDYDTSKDGYVVPLSKDQIDKAPKHGQGDMPAYDTDYSRRVHGYYGTDY
jgi:hypothetical protein